MGSRVNHDLIFIKRKNNQTAGDADSTEFSRFRANRLFSAQFASRDQAFEA
jgi:hypothetical protein